MNSLSRMSRTMHPDSGAKRTEMQRWVGKVLLPAAPDGCWQWIGGKDSDGYGIFRAGHGSVRVHRYVYKLFVGPIPEGLTLDHLCRNRACVNPAHLEPVTCRENILRGVSIMARRARQTHCLRGHPLAGSNLRIDPRGGRFCWACATLRARAYQTRRRAKVSA